MIHGVFKPLHHAFLPQSRCQRADGDNQTQPEQPLQVVALQKACQTAIDPIRRFLISRDHCGRDGVFRRKYRREDAKKQQAEPGHPQRDGPWQDALPQLWRRRGSLIFAGSRSAVCQVFPALGILQQPVQADAEALPQL